LLVLLHGRGADANDLFPLLDYLDPERRFVGVTPQAPLRLPPGGFHWYSLGGLPTPDPATFDPTYELATAWLDALVEEHGLGYERLVLGGFSQGGVMTYALALGAGRPRPARMIVMSSFVPRVPGLVLELGEAPPVAIAHGAYDEIIPVDFGREAKQLLEAAGVDPLYREFPFAHQVAPQFLEELRPWLREVVEGGE
jgi:phospholipase/carboxylesterase